MNPRSTTTKSNARMMGTDPANSSSISVSTEVIRPEARRAYGEGNVTNNSNSGSIGGYSKSTGDKAARVKMDTSLMKEEERENLLLQQAAAYAPLASLNGAETRLNSSLRRFRNHPIELSSDGGRRTSTNKEELELDSNLAQGILVDSSKNSSSYGSSSSSNNSSSIGGNKVHNKFIRSTRFFRTPRLEVDESQGMNSALSSPSSSLLFPSRNISRSDQRHDVEGYDAPRLSISSTEESSNGSEVKTPESLNELLNWNKAASLSSTCLIKGEEEYHPPLYQNRKAREIGPMMIPPVSSPPLVDFADGLVDSGLIGETAQVTNEEKEIDPAMRIDWMEKSRQQDYNNEEVLISSEENLSPTDLPLQNRGGSTIRAKRPSALLRLPSAKTDDTARPSPPSTIASSAGPTPAATADNSYGKSRDPMEDAILTISSDQELSAAFQEESRPSSSAHGSNTSFDSHQVTTTRSSNAEESSFEATDHDHSSQDRSGVASPDSWRSLLPEHDPYFISNEALNYRSSSRTQSLSGLAGGVGGGGNNRSGMQGRDRDYSASMIQTSSEGQMNLLNDRENRRLSIESIQSSAFSHSNINPMITSIYASSNASGSLYDLDGTFNSGGSRAAFAPLSYQYNQSTKSLTSPSLSAIGKENALINPVQEPIENEEGLEEINSFQGLSFQGSSFQGSSIQGSSAALQSAAARRHASFSAFDNNSSLPSSSVFSIQTNHQPFIHPDHHDRSRVLGNHKSQLVNWEMSPERRQSFQWGPSQSTRLGSISKSSRVSPSSPTSSAMGNEGDRESWPCSRRLDNQPKM